MSPVNDLATFCQYFVTRVALFSPVKLSYSRGNNKRKMCIYYLWKH